MLAVMLKLFNSPKPPRVSWALVQALGGFVSNILNMHIGRCIENIHIVFSFGLIGMLEALPVQCWKFTYQATSRLEYLIRGPLNGRRVTNVFELT